MPVPVQVHQKTYTATRSAEVDALLKDVAQLLQASRQPILDCAVQTYLVRAMRHTCGALRRCLSLCVNVCLRPSVTLSPSYGANATGNAMTRTHVHDTTRAANGRRLR